MPAAVICNMVQYGFFGVLEIISRIGTLELTKYLENWPVEFSAALSRPSAGARASGAFGAKMPLQKCMDHQIARS